jgi:hypothetical protein
MRFREPNGEPTATFTRPARLRPATVIAGRLPVGDVQHCPATEEPREEETPMIYLITMLIRWACC